MINIEVDEVIENDVQRPGLQRAASAALSAVGVKEVSLTVMITGDARVRSLNKAHRGVDETTDVLAFPADYVDPDLGHRYVGDVIISLPRAEAQAEEGGHAVGDELQLLVVHGVLHLLDFDHKEEGDKREMAALQSQVLKDLGVDLEVKGWGQA